MTEELPSSWPFDRSRVTGSHVFVTGPGGGGRVFAGWLLGISPESLVATGELGGMSYSSPTGTVEEIGDDQSDFGPSGVLVRGVDTGDSDAPPLVHDLRWSPEGAAVMRLLAAASGLADEAGEALSGFSPATALFDSFVATGNPGEDVLSLARSGRLFRGLLARLTKSLDFFHFDLARIVALLSPVPVHVGDEWANMATHLTGRTLSVGDINRLLVRYPDLWEITDQGVRASSPFVAQLVTGLVPLSTSEYYSLYRYLKERAPEMLFRRDGADSFVARQLPWIAAKAGALEEFLDDGPAVLVSDLDGLIHNLEGSPEIMVRPPAKAVLLSSHHRRGRDSTRSSQLELSLRRLSLTTQANEIARLFPSRAWVPVWSVATPVNVHRVLRDHTSTVLGVTLAYRDGQPVFVSVHSDGSAMATFLDGRPETLWQDAENPAELRAISSGGTDHGSYVGLASSDSVIRVFDVAGGKLLWENASAHSEPLSTCTMGTDASGRLLIVTAGVAGRILVHDAISGEEVLPPIRHEGEVRGVAIASVAGVDVLAYCSVNGYIGVLDLADGTEKAGKRVNHGCNALAAAVIDGVLRLSVGTSEGNLLWIELDEQAWTLSVSDVTPAQIPREGIEVNSVAIYSDADGIRTAVARSDGVVLVLDESGSAVQVLSGHVGAVNAVFVASSDAFGTSGELVLVSAGTDGSVRLWRHVATRQESLARYRLNRHQGAVTQVSIAAHDDAVEVVTGGADGTVRMWSTSKRDEGNTVSRHGGEITAILDVGEGADRRLIIGAGDGSIRRLDPNSNVDEPKFLGMAHEGVTAIVGASDRSSFWSGGRNGSVTRWDMLTGMPEDTKKPRPLGSVQGLVLFASGLVVASQDGYLSLLDPEAMTPIGDVDVGTGIRAMASVPTKDGVLVLGTSTGKLRVNGHFTASNEEERSWDAHTGVISAVTVFMMANELFVASAGRDRRIQISSFARGEVLQTIDLEGLPTSLHVEVPYISASTTSGVSVFRLNENQHGPRV